MKKVRHILLILALAMLPMLFSCELSTTDENDVDIVIICSGSATANEFTYDLILDDNAPFSNQNGSNSIVLPAGNIEKATISVTRVNQDASLTIAIYNNNELDEKGYATLDTCTSTATSCSNTLSLQYEVKSEEETDSTAAKSTSSTSSTSSSSSSGS